MVLFICSFPVDSKQKIMYYNYMQELDTQTLAEAEEYRRGRGSFAMSVTSYNDFEEALFRKLTAEIALMK